MSDELSPEVRNILANIKLVIIAEKPSVARDIAETLGIKKKAAQHNQHPFFADSQRLITWSFGHLLRLAEPHEINQKWKTWLAEDLPILPERWPLLPTKSNVQHLFWLKKLLQISGLDEVVNAMDAGREGELIFQHIYNFSECKVPVRRMWMSSLTKDAILSAFELRRGQHEYRGLALAAQQRAQADWLIGMNMSRAMSIRYNQPFSIGRVQTPTLSMIVERDRSIENFSQSSYFNIALEFGIGSEIYKSLCLNSKKIENEALKKAGAHDLTLKNSEIFPQDSFVFFENELPTKSQEKMLEGAALKHISRKKRLLKTQADLVADLTTLQKKANELYHFSAQKTLDISQSLYEKHKLISYPRTNSRYLSGFLKDSLADLARQTAFLFKEIDGLDIDFCKIPSRAIDDTKVDDHHGIIPTKNIEDKKRLDRLSKDEAKIFDLICRYFVGLWLPDYKVELHDIVFETSFENCGKIVESPLYFEFQNGKTSVISVFRSRHVLAEGFKTLWRDVAKNTANKGLQSRQIQGQQAQIPDDLIEYLKQPSDRIVEKCKSIKVNTRPPLFYTEATLLSAMQAAGHNLEDKKLKKYLTGKGLGTAATRAGIIESLIEKKYITRDGRFLKSSDLGRDLIFRTLATLKSPQLTAEWEDAFNLIEKDVSYVEKFTPELHKFVRSAIQEMWLVQEKNLSDLKLLAKQTLRPFINSNASPSSKLEWGLQEVFKFGSFQAHQRLICEALIEGKDALLVMPTGSGKSLCYQLPAIILGRAALVISPLIALMQDQVQSLQRLGLRAASIHSGLSRFDSR
nr:DEAD/DEAH box helicase [Oligoflexales bacterium]